MSTRHWASKLTPIQVAEIQVSTDKLAVVAKKYGVSPTTIHNIRRGNTWATTEGKERILLDRAQKALSNLAAFYDGDDRPESQNHKRFEVNKALGILWDLANPTKKGPANES